MSKKLKILISGGTGFVGKALIERANRSHFVYALNRRKSETKQTYPVFVPTDWNNIILLSKTMEGMDAFVHCAGLAHGKDGDMMNINHDLTVNLATAAIKAKLSQFIFISSVSVLGASGYFDITNQPNPSNAYGLSKLKAEQSLYRLFKDEKTVLTIIRPPMIIGKDAPGHAQALRGIISKGWPLPFAGLKASRSYITLDRLYDTIEKTVKNNTKSLLIHSESGHVSAADLIRIIADENDLKARLFYVPALIFSILSLIPSFKSKLFPLLNDHVIKSEMRTLDS